MIDNFDLIRPLLKFDNPGDFYFLQIYKRRKDNPDMKKDMLVLDNYFIRSLEKFDEYKPRIIHQCNYENARAYLRLNVRNDKKIALQLLKKVTDMIISEAYSSLKGAYTAVCGEFHSDPDKTWIVDLDTKEYSEVDVVADVISGCRPFTNTKIKIVVPSKNGFHIIARPFDLQEFRKTYPEIDVHKDNPTILYTT